MPTAPAITPPYISVVDSSPVDFSSAMDTNLGGDSNNQANVREEIKRLSTTHPLYADYYPLWQFYLSAFEGGTSFANADNLHKHMRENQEDFKSRCERIHYTNYCAPLTTFFTDFIFSDTIQRDGGSKPDFFTSFVSDVTLRGDDITDFMSSVSDNTQIFGMTYGLVDAPVIPEGVLLTKQDDDVVRPFWVELLPFEILDWIVDDFEKFLYVKRKQTITTVSPRGVKSIIDRYTEWQPSTVTITDIDVTNPSSPTINVSNVKNEIGIVPLVVNRYKRSKRNSFMGVSFLVDLAMNNKEVMNLTSLEQEFLYRQCFNILAMEQPDQLPTAGDQDQQISTSNIVEFPKGGSAPQYIVPSSAPSVEIRSERREIVAEMYRRAAQDTMNELFNGGGSSGFSKAQNFRTTVPRIATRAESLEKFEKKMFALTYKYSKSIWDGAVKYKDHYEITSIADVLSQLTTMFGDLLMPSETFAKEEMMHLVHLFDGKIAPDKLKQIASEIENNDWKEWFDAFKLKALGRASTSPDVGLAFNEPVTAANMTTKGKDTATSSSTSQKPQDTMQTIVATSNQ